ncbi:hypothetical protein [Natronobiforma cellulositropha]|uniref:hypothetical protein n=1 Tax=Natronobiforma cellulositropha TaxID=1679076 RepID=UPI0021D613EC|nr:hypothetical protein [Natronobiforma cellulositropha]
MTSTHGYDVVVQIDEREFNDQVALQFATGGDEFGMPLQIRDTEAIFALEIEFNFLFDTPFVDFSDDPATTPLLSKYDWGQHGVAGLEPATDRTVTFCLPFSSSLIEISGQVDAPDLDGCFLIQQEFEIRDAPGQDEAREVVLPIDEDVDEVAVGFTAESAATIDAGDGLLGDADSISQAMAITVRDELEEISEEIPLTPQPLELQPVVSDPDHEYDVATPVDLDARLIRTDSSNCLAFLMATHPETTGNPDAFQTSQTTAANPIVVMVDEETVISRLLCSELAEALDVDPDVLDSPCRFTGSAPIPVDDVDEVDDLSLESLEVRFVDGHIEVTGTAEGSGSYKKIPFDVEADILLEITLEFEDGEIVVNIEEDIDVDVKLSTWASIAGAVIGAITGGIAGAITAFVVIKLVDVIGDRMASGFVDDFVGSELADVDSLSIPLGPLAEVFTVESVEITPDSLLLAGNAAYDESLPLAASGMVGLAPGNGVDLDTGTVDSLATPVQSGIDLSWRASGDGVRAHNGATIVPLGWTSFANLTPIDLEQLDYQGDGTTFVSASAIPSTPFSPWSPGWTTFAVRTADQRYAKCRVRRVGAVLELTFVTYERPQPGVEVDTVVEITDREEIDSGVETWTEFECRSSYGLGGGRFGGGLVPIEHSATYTVETVARRITASLEKSLLAYPLETVEWRLDGTVIEGEGVLDVDGYPISYDVDGTECELTTELGTPLEADLCGAVVDDRGLALAGCEWFDLAGTQKSGGKPPATGTSIPGCLAGLDILREDLRPLHPDFWDGPFPKPPVPIPGRFPDVGPVTTPIERTPDLERFVESVVTDRFDLPAEGLDRDTARFDADPIRSALVRGMDLEPETLQREPLRR